MYLLGIQQWIWEAINSIWFMLCDWIYSFISFIYQVFMKIASVNLFSIEIFKEITGRIYVVMGIAMLFIFAYNLVLMIINPDDKKSTGNTTKIVKETIIALVLIILLPTVFRYMTVFQNHILSSHIIESIILGAKSDSGTEDCNFDNFTVINDAVDKEATKTLTEYCTKYSNLEISQKGAYLVAPTLFTAFFAPTDYSYNDCLAYVKGETHDSAIDTDDDKKLCAKYVYDVNMAKFSGGILPFIGMDGVYTDAMDDGFFDFNYLMAFIAGILAVYMFFCYTMEIGVRVAKLGFLQLISPIPVMLRIIPKQKEAFYDKWFKNLLNTYLDVFIRLAIIYFAMFAISLVPDVMAMLLGANYGKGLIGALAAVVVILGLLKFAQEAPALFKEFFGNAGRFSLKNPLKDNRGLDIARAGIYGATTGQGFKGRVGGFFSGAARGAYGGYDKAVKGLDTARTERENGSTFGGRTLDRLRMGIGMEKRADSEDRRTNRLNENIKINNEDSKKLKEIKSKATDAITKETSKVLFDGFSFDGVDFSKMKYVQVKEYEDVLKSSYESATDEARKKAAYQKLIKFQNEFGKAMKAKVDSGVDSLIAGVDFYGAFDDSDYATVKSNIADVISNEHKDLNGNIITSISKAKDLSNALESMSADSRTKSNEISEITTKKGYKARHADARMVSGQGKAEKK